MHFIKNKLKVFFVNPNIFTCDYIKIKENIKNGEIIKELII